MSIDLSKLGIQWPDSGSVWRSFMQAVLTRRNVPVNIVHALAGRGAAKTFFSMVCLFILMTDRRYGYVGEEFTWYGPTTNTEDFDDTFLGTWEKLVPEELYKINLSRKRIYLPNGSVLKYRGRLATNSNRDPARGPGGRVVVLDETCKDPTNKAWTKIFGTLRGYQDRARPYIIITASTPVLGSWYQDVVEGGNDVVFTATSYDNPVANPEVIDKFADQMSEAEVEQEIEGKWVALTSLAWNNANLKDDWPNGNMHPHTFDPSMPFSVWCDLGVQSAWIIVQHPRTHSGHYLDVAVAEITPNDGDTDKIGQLINDEYGNGTYPVPSLAVVGRDLNTRGVTQNKTSKTVLQNYGWPVIKPVIPPWNDKLSQYQTGKRCLLTRSGHRQFCISRGLEKHFPNHRGLMELFKRDTWPERAIMGEFLPKDKRTKGGQALEDMRDAWMYGCIMTHKPRNYGADIAGQQAA